MYIIIHEIESLVGQWLAEAETLRNRHGDERGATTTTTLACELRARLDVLRHTSVDIATARELTGYSEDRLRGLIREGKIANAGEKYSPRIYLCDLPNKPGALRPAMASRDVPGAREQVVRSVASES